MSVKFEVVAESEKDIRLDRWFKRHYPAVTHGLLEKWLRKKYVRVDDKKALSNMRLAVGQIIRVPSEKKDIPVLKEKKLSKADISLIQGMVLYKEINILFFLKVFLSHVILLK